MAWLSADFDSKALHMPVSMDIIMPQGHGNYKTVYLLHGAGGDKTTWLLKTRILDYAQKCNLAVIMPSGNNSFYINNRHGKDYGDFISQELPKLCETWFSISNRREDRLIAGMSMGGYGAFANAMHYPQIFGNAASFSGVLDIMERYDYPQGLEMDIPFGSREELLDSENDLFAMTKKMKKNALNKGESRVRYMIMCGEQDKRLNMSQKMYQHMKDLDYEVSFHTEPGRHDFQYWDKCIEQTLDWFVGGE